MIKMFVVIAFIAGDVITGLIKAIATTGLNSTVLRKGLIRKSTEIITAAGAFGLDYGIRILDIGLNFEILSFITIYLVIMELISMLENLSEVNPALARLFSPMLEKLKNKKEEMEKNDEN